MQCFDLNSHLWLGPWGLKVNNCTVQQASLVGNNYWPRFKGLTEGLIYSMMMKWIWEISCAELLKWMANSQVLSFLKHVWLVVMESYFKLSQSGDYILQVAFGTSGQIPVNKIVFVEWDIENQLQNLKLEDWIRSILKRWYFLLKQVKSWRIIEDASILCDCEFHSSDKMTIVNLCWHADLKCTCYCCQ